MREYSSINVSAYDAASLAERLTEQSRDGWDVVSIVSTGSSVTAYLSRDADDDNGTSDVTASDDSAANSQAVGVISNDDHAADGVSSDEADGAPSGMTTASSDVQADAVHADASGAEARNVYAADAEVPTLAPAADGHPDAAEDDDSSLTDTVADAASSAAETASGWASSVADTVQEAFTDDGGAVDQTSTDAAGATDQAAGTAGGAPAGWYADPAGRFELRYWDGAQWTEHVSRQGQQFTDPPVA